MGFDAEWQLAGCMRSGMRGSGYPKGWLSEKRPCPICEKLVAGRQVGMAEHIRAKHGLSRCNAMDKAFPVWRHAQGTSASGRDPKGLEGEAPQARSEGCAPTSSPSDQPQ